MTIEEQLTHIGLGSTESATYLAALQHGPATVLAIARATGYNRPLVTKTIERLTSEGLVTMTLSGKRRLYAAAPPRSLLALVQRRENLLKELLPDLESLFSAETPQTRVTYFEGREQVQRLLRTQNGARRKEILAYFPAKFMIQLFGKRQLESVIRERIRHKIKVRILRSRTTDREYEGWELRNEALREVRHIPDDKPLGMGIVIFDTTVNLFAPANENFGMQIESAAFAGLMRYFFETLWGVSTEV